MLITDLTHHQHFPNNLIIHQELRNKVSQLELSLKDAKEDLEVTMTLIGKADKKITAAEQGVKARREKMLGVQVISVQITYTYSFFFQDKLGDAILTGKIKLLLG